MLTKRFTLPTQPARGIRGATEWDPNVIVLDTYTNKNYPINGSFTAILISYPRHDRAPGSATLR